MLAGLPTAAIQTFAGEQREEREDGRKPFQLDQCHALETSYRDGEEAVPKMASRAKEQMKIHEYQGKEIFRKFGMPTPRGIACFSASTKPSRRRRSWAAASGW